MYYQKKVEALIANGRKQNQYIYIPPDLTVRHDGQSRLETSSSNSLSRIWTLIGWHLHSQEHDVSTTDIIIQYFELYTWIKPNDINVDIGVIVQPLVL